MKDWMFIANEFKTYGINDFQCRNAVIPLDKVLGLDEKRHDGGLNPYGVSEMSLYGSGVRIEYYVGSILNPYVVCSSGRFKSCASKNKRLLTESEENGIYDFCMSLINERKEIIERNKYWNEHFDEFVDECLSFAKEFVSNADTTYNVDLCVGNSLADTRVAPALVIKYKSDGSQRGYIKINKNKFGDVNLDVCCMTHVEFKVKDQGNTDKLKEIIANACKWCL